MLSPVLALPNFELLIKVKCESSGIGIGAILTQAWLPLGYFSEKLNGSRLNYSPDDKDFYNIVRVVDHWNHNLKPKHFVLHSSHNALSLINGKHKPSIFHLLLQAKEWEKEKLVAHALSRDMCYH